jgi:glutamine amidotransferase-like uncharacterized protein
VKASTFAFCLASLCTLSLTGQAQTKTTAPKKPPFVVPPDVNGLKTIIAPVTSQRSLNVAVFSGSGSPQSSVDVLVKAVGHIEGAKATVLKGTEIGTTDLKAFDVIAFPGGSGSGQSKTLGEAGLKNVREFVREGGGYVGICAGAYLACSNFKWGLGILNASTVSSKWQRGKAFLDSEVTEVGRQLLGDVRGTFKVRYGNGPVIKPAERTDIPAYTTISVFKSEIAENGTPVGVMVDSPAQAQATFGKGRVFISSPHPENTPGLEHLIPRGVLWAAGVDAP